MFRVIDAWRVLIWNLRFIRFLRNSNRFARWRVIIFLSLCGQLVYAWVIKIWKQNKNRPQVLETSEILHSKKIHSLWIDNLIPFFLSLPIGMIAFLKIFRARKNAVSTHYFVNIVTFCWNRWLAVMLLNRLTETALCSCQLIQKLVPCSYRPHNRNLATRPVTLKPSYLNYQEPSSSEV